MVCMMNGETELHGVELYTPQVFGDKRGWFKENWRENGPLGKYNFVQENVSKSQKGVLRGLHFQSPKAQGKLVTVLNGSALDVIIDLRPDSPTYLEAENFLLTDVNGYQLYVPEGFGHGFLSLEDDTVFHYKCTDYYDPEGEYCLRWDNEITQNLWYGVPHSFILNVSEKDKGGMNLDKCLENNHF
jgi:dTDP-4-dehydrorhamnose 3,5-epimerase